MSKKVSDLPELVDPENTDLLTVTDISEDVSKKVKVEDVLKDVPIDRLERNLNICELRLQSRQILPAGTWTDVLFDEVMYDPNGMYDSDLQTIVIKEAGMYIVTANLSTDVATTQGGWGLGRFRCNQLTEHPNNMSAYLNTTPHSLNVNMALLGIYEVGDIITAGAYVYDPTQYLAGEESYARQSFLKVVKISN